MIPKFEKEQIVKCILPTPSHEVGHSYIVIDNNVITDFYLIEIMKDILIKTNKSFDFQSKFIPAKEKLPEEWL